MTPLIATTPSRLHMYTAIICIYLAAKLYSYVCTYISDICLPYIISYTYVYLERCTSFLNPDPTSLRELLLLFFSVSYAFIY